MQFVAKHRKLASVSIKLCNKLIFNNKNHGGGVTTEYSFALLRGCKIVNKGSNNRIIIGDYSRLNHCTFHFFGSNNTVFIDEFCFCNQADFWIEDDGNTIHLGKHTSLSGKIQLAAMEGTRIEIGQDCLFSSNIAVRTGDSHSLIQCDTGKRINQSKSISIGDHVWVGTNVTILKGTHVPRHSVVGACSLLCKEYTNPNCVLAGVPAKEVKCNINWKTERIKSYGDS